MSTLYDDLLDSVETAATCPTCGQSMHDLRTAELAWHDRHMSDVRDVCRVVASKPGILRQALRRELHEAWGRPKPTNHARATAAINDAQALGWIRVEPGVSAALHHYPVEAVTDTTAGSSS